MNKNMLAIALASLLVGGVAAAAYVSTRDPAPRSALAAGEFSGSALDATAHGDVRPDHGPIPSPPAAPARLEYAEVLSARPLIEREPRYATVIGTAPVRETVAGTAPREVCEDVAVEERLPERDGNVGGTVAGALIGGLVGNQVGDGNGRKAATVAGAAAGGYIGNRIDRRHEGGRVVTRTERQCRTVSEATRSTRTVAWDVTYRTPEGTTGTLRTERRPGERIALGSDERVIGYDVTYRLDGREGRIRTAEDPGARLPVLDGRVMAPAAETLPDRG